MSVNSYRILPCGEITVVGLHDLAVAIGRHCELAAAFADRKLVQRVDIVRRHANDGGAQRLVLIRGFGEIVRFDRAALGERGREEVQHDGPLL
ncbi:hypothetical protein G6F60_015278 [Rhizopus arrhizus]|nr:hypothetical protein G6F60_015278 [Rhizopus arrhizus]